MNEYKRWKHAAWALVLTVVAACAGDAGDEAAEDDDGHAQDRDEDAEPGASTQVRA